MACWARGADGMTRLQLSVCLVLPIAAGFLLQKNSYGLTILAFMLIYGGVIVWCSPIGSDISR